MPAVLAARITDDLAGMLGSAGAVWAVIHANHPSELTDEFRLAVRRSIRAGVPVLNQVVLLRGVNADAETLDKLVSRARAGGGQAVLSFPGRPGNGHGSLPGPPGARHRPHEGASRAAFRHRAPPMPWTFPAGWSCCWSRRSCEPSRYAYVLHGPDGKEYRYPRNPGSDRTQMIGFRSVAASSSKSSR